MCWIKFGRDVSILEVLPEEQGPQPHTRPPVHCSSNWKRSLFNLRLQKAVGIVAEWKGGLLRSQAFLLGLLGLSCSEFQHWVSSSKGARHILKGTELSGIRERAGGSDLSPQKFWQRHYSFSEPAGMSYIWVSISLAITIFPNSGDSLRCCRSQLVGLTQAASSGFSIRMAYLGSCFRLS